MKNGEPAGSMCRTASRRCLILNLTRAIIDTAKEMEPDLSGKVYYGINASDDAFYGDTGMDRKLSALGCLNVEMENALYAVCHRRKESCHDQRRGNLITGR